MAFLVFPVKVATDSLTGTIKSWDFTIYGNIIVRTCQDIQTESFHKTVLVGFSLSAGVYLVFVPVK